MSTIADVLSGRARWACLEADCAQELPRLPPQCVDHTLNDPPFSAHVHSLQRRVMTGPHRQFARQRGGKARDLKYHGNPVVADLGFEHLSPELRRLCGTYLPRVTRRWIIVKSDEEGRHLWQADLERAGGRHVRAGTWWKIGAQPQLSGRMPAVDREALQISHRRGTPIRWNGGGKHASWCAIPEHLVYRFPIATDRNGTGERVHTTQTPLALWLAVVADFTDPGEIVLDPFMGSGSLGVACVRLGRRYIGMDNGKNEEGVPWAAIASQALEAAANLSTRGAARAGQFSLFGEAK
jgi:site-specific DNA-methyltransferase (adenine-specific)